MQARVNVPDDRFKWLCEQFKPKSEIPAFLEIVDIAGLVKCAARCCVEAMPFPTSAPVVAAARRQPARDRPQHCLRHSKLAIIVCRKQQP